MNTNSNQVENVKVEKLKMSHYAFYNDIIIDTAPEEVWSVLTDTKSYKDWAAMLVDIQGEIKNGAKNTFVFQLDPAKEKFTTIEHTITVVEGEEFYWAEKEPGGIRDNHHFKVEPADNGKTRFIQTDEIMKGLTWLMGGRLSKIYAQGYPAFNRSLKAEVERRFNK